jgi:hypothetical protein
VKVGSIVIRFHGFDEMMAFWQGALHFAPREPTEDGWVALRDLEGSATNVFRERVAEPFGRTSRVHLDLYTTDQAGKVGRLIGLGATRYPWKYRPDGDCVVLEDPDGNRLCVVQVPGRDQAIL